jgi:microcystin-dependent protein
MDFFLAQIGIYGFNFAPRGWALCAGNILPITQNTALYSLIGTYYGGNGQTTFALPDMRSRSPVGVGSNVVIGEMAGTETVTLLNSEMPMHNHPMAVNNALATSKFANNNVFGQGTDGTNPLPTYVVPAANVVLNPLTISLTGGSQAHNNIQPCLAVNYCIATTGIYPSRN